MDCPYRDGIETETMYYYYNVNTTIIMVIKFWLLAKFSALILVLVYKIHIASTALLYLLSSISVLLDNIKGQA